jgi:hypothetical protein
MNILAIFRELAALKFYFLMKQVILKAKKKQKKTGALLLKTPHTCPKVKDYKAKMFHPRDREWGRGIDISYLD